MLKMQPLKNKMRAIGCWLLLFIFEFNNTRFLLCETTPFSLLLLLYHGPALSKHLFGFAFPDTKLVCRVASVFSDPLCGHERLVSAADCLGAQQTTEKQPGLF